MKFIPEMEYQDVKDLQPLTLALVSAGVGTAWAITGVRQMKQGSPVQAATFRALPDEGAPAFVVDKREGVTGLAISEFIIQADVTKGVQIHKNPYSIAYPSSALLISGKKRWLVVYVLDDYDSKNAYALDLETGAIQPFAPNIYVTVIEHFRIGIPGDKDPSWVLTIAPLKPVTQSA